MNNSKSSKQKADKHRIKQESQNTMSIKPLKSIAYPMTCVVVTKCNRIRHWFIRLITSLHKYTKSENFFTYNNIKYLW